MAFGALGVYGQDKPRKQKSTEKQYKEFMDLRKSREANRDEAMNKAREEHLERQTKQTRKRMKKHEKMMRRVKAGKHPKTFFQRLFTKKS